MWVTDPSQTFLPVCTFVVIFSAGHITLTRGGERLSMKYHPRTFLEPTPDDFQTLIPLRQKGGVYIDGLLFAT